MYASYRTVKLKAKRLLSLGTLTVILVIILNFSLEANGSQPAVAQAPCT
jgi:hypothetical protein